MYEVDKGNCPSFYQAFVLSFVILPIILLYCKHGVLCLFSK
jgi:hypothetical protein